MTESGPPQGNSINTTAGGEDPKSELTAEQLMRYVGIAAIYLITLVAYIPAMRGGFVWDDDYYVVANRSLRSFDGLRTIWLGIADPQAYRIQVVPQYYPMTLTSLWLDYRFWGAGAVGYHLMNVLLHATSALLLWTILRKLSVRGAWVIAAVWAVHPVNVESVAWITERKNVLSGVFYFCSLLIWMRYCGLDPAPKLSAGQKPVLPTDSWKLYALSLFLFGCALLSKSVTGSLPAVMLLLLWWKRGRVDWKKELAPLLPFFALAILAGAFTTFMERNVVGAQGHEWAYSLPQRFLIAGRAIWFYAWKLVWPADLIFMYRKWDIGLPQQAWQMLFGVAAIGVAVALFVLRAKIGRGPVVAFLFFIGTLFPALGFINVLPMRYAFVADHFQYLASVGLIALIVGSVFYILKVKDARVALAAVVIGVLGFLTFRQSRIYATPITLWTDTLARNPDSWMAHNNLGAILLFEGKDREALKEFQAVREAGRKDSAIPQMEALMNIGLVAERAGDAKNAEAYFLAAIHECRKDDVHLPRCAGPLYNLGALYSKTGQTDQAMRAYQAALESNPYHTLALINLGVIYAGKGDYTKAIDLYTKALEIDPDSVSGRTNLGDALFAQGNINDAVAQWQEVQRLDPDNARVRNAIGGALLHIEQWDKAIDMFNEALRLDPNLEPAKKNLALARRLKQQAATRPSTTRASVPTTMPTTTPASPR